MKIWQIKGSIEILLGVPLQNAMNSRHFLHLNLRVSQALHIFIACLNYLPNKPLCELKGPYFLHSHYHITQQALISSVAQKKMFLSRDPCFTPGLFLWFFSAQRHSLSETKAGFVLNAAPQGTQIPPILLQPSVWGGTPQLGTRIRGLWQRP